MYVCMYACIYACMYVCNVMYICMYVFFLFTAFSITGSNTTCLERSSYTFYIICISFHLTLGLQIWLIASCFSWLRVWDVLVYIKFYTFYVCMYVCMHVCMYVCVSMYVHMYVCVCVCMYVCMYACMYVCMYVCMHVCMYVCMHVCVVCECMCQSTYVHRVMAMCAKRKWWRCFHLQLVLRHTTARS